MYNSHFIKLFATNKILSYALRKKELIPIEKIIWKYK